MAKRQLTDEQKADKAEADKAAAAEAAAKSGQDGQDGGQDGQDGQNGGQDAKAAKDAQGVALSGLVGLGKAGDVQTIEVPGTAEVGGYRQWLADLDQPQLVVGSRVASVTVGPIRGAKATLYVAVLQPGRGAVIRKVGVSRYTATRIDGVRGKGLAFVRYDGPGVTVIVKAVKAAKR